MDFGINFQVWDAEKMTLSGEINQPNEPEGICSISANASTLFTGAQSKNIKIWSLHQSS